MKRREIFERRDPPPGGLEKLRQRMRDREASRHAPWPRPVGVGALALAAAGLFLLVRPRGPDVLAAARSYDGASEVALGLAPSPVEPLTLAVESRGTTAIARVPTSDVRVAIYRVETLE